MRTLLDIAVSIVVLVALMVVVLGCSVTAWLDDEPIWYRG